MKLANTLALLFTTASSLMLTAYADDELATPAHLRAAATHSSSAASSSVISSSFLKQADDIKAKLVVKKEKSNLRKCRHSSLLRPKKKPNPNHAL